MRTLSATLLAAQRSGDAEPYVRVRLSDLDVGMPRLRWERWYAGDEPAGPCGVAVAGDGALLRARVDAADGALWHQRVASPSAASTYSAWTSLGTVHVAARIGMAAAGMRVLIASVRAGGTGVEVRESTDGGATFAASSLLTTAGGAVTAVACSMQADGTAAVFYAWGGVVYVVQRTGTGGWSMPSAWSRSLANVTGIAAWSEGDHQVLVSGTQADGAAGVWSCIYGAGAWMPPGFWSVLGEVASASAGTSISYLASGVCGAGGPRAVFVERYGGGGAYERAHLASALLDTTFADQAWRDAQPLDITGAHGAGCAGSADAAWLAVPDGLWHAGVSVAVDELGADVLELDVQQAREQGRARLVLRNDDGRYHAGASPAALVPGGELRIDSGYVTGAGPEVSEGMRFWITSVRRLVAGGSAVVEVEAVDGWGLLEAWTAPRQLVWGSGGAPAATVLTAIAARVGLPVVSDGASGESAALRPAFSVRPGERAATAFRRLLGALPDLVVARPAALVLHEPREGDATDYVYGGEPGSGHAVLEGRVEDAPGGAGWARVFGRGVFAEAVDAPALLAGAGTAMTVDDNLAVQARAEARAGALLRKTALAVPRGEIVVAPNAGQEVGDVVTVSASGLGLDGARFRVAALRLQLARGGRRPRYAMTLSLSAV